METNLLVAIINLIKNPISDLKESYHFSNRINNMGDALEFYIKDLFCNSLSESNQERKNEIYNEHFSYLGNQNNPPDIIIKNGDAIEVKKIESPKPPISLNSSYPKDKLFSDSPMITAACKDAEEWIEKDVIYAIGVLSEGKLTTLWFLYGDCYAANKECYERVRDKITVGISGLQNVELSETSELGRVNKIDPLGITYLRIRGMWGIQNPIKVFDYVVPNDQGFGFSAHAIMLKEKYFSFPKHDKEVLESLVGKNFSMKNIKIKSPNNPAKLLDSILLSFKR